MKTNMNDQRFEDEVNILACITPYSKKDIIESVKNSMWYTGMTRDESLEYLKRKYGLIDEEYY